MEKFVIPKVCPLTVGVPCLSMARYPRHGDAHQQACVAEGPAINCWLSARSIVDLCNLHGRTALGTQVLAVNDPRGALEIAEGLAVMLEERSAPPFRARADLGGVFAFLSPLGRARPREEPPWGILGPRDCDELTVAIEFFRRHGDAGIGTYGNLGRLQPVASHGNGIGQARATSFPTAASPPATPTPQPVIASPRTSPPADIPIPRRRRPVEDIAAPASRDSSARGLSFAVGDGLPPEDLPPPLSRAERDTTVPDFLRDADGDDDD